MNIADRRRVSSLIEGAFQDRLEVARERVSDVDVEREGELLLKSYGLAGQVKKLRALESRVEEERRLLSESLLERDTSGEGGVKRRGGCECHESYERVLERLSRHSLETKRGGEAKCKELREERRKLLARVEVATSVEDLHVILRDCGLLK